MGSKSRWSDKGFELLARFGFLARGLIYLVMGIIAAQAAFLQRGRTVGPAGAMQRILTGWNGPVALSIICAGLLCFVFFRLAQARRATKLHLRIGALVSALGILVLAASAIQLLVRLRAAPEGETLREWGTWILSQPLGPESLALGGAIAIIAGAVEVVRALLGKLNRDFTAAVMERENRKWVTRLARAGVFTHGIVLAIVGLSIARAGLDANPRELADQGDAIRTIRKTPAPYVFTVAAAGLLAYGASMMVLAAHRRKRMA